MTALPMTIATAPSGAKVVMKPGFDYMVITINLKKEQKFGMVVKNLKSMVVVSVVAPGSMCAGLMKEMDQIIEVNGTPVTDRDQCKDLVIRSLKEKKAVSLFLSRPMSPQAINEMEQLMNASLMLPSIELRSDVRDIQRRFNTKLQVTPAGQKKGILIHPGTQVQGNVKITETMTPYMIATDMSCRLGQLQKVPAKQPMPSPRQDFSQDTPLQQRMPQDGKQEQQVSPLKIPVLQQPQLSQQPLMIFSSQVSAEPVLEKNDGRVEGQSKEQKELQNVSKESRKEEKEQEEFSSKEQQTILKDTNLKNRSVDDASLKHLIEEAKSNEKDKIPAPSKKKPSKEEKKKKWSKENAANKNQENPIT